MKIYLDNSATTKPLESVVKKIENVLTNDFGNPSSLYRLGITAEKYLQDTREKIATFLKVQPKEIFFTSGGTEANNWAVLGSAFQNKGRGKKIITSGIEHASLLASCRRLEEMGFEVFYLPVDKNGIVDLDVLKNTISEDTILVSIMHVNNEVGSIQPLKEISEIVKEKSPAVFHVDAVQSFGKIDLEPRKLGIDMLTISGHKIHGPKGVGALYIKENVPIKPLLVGGGQEKGLRAGTENVPGIAGMGQAVEDLLNNFSNIKLHLKTLKETFVEQLSDCEGVHFNSDPNLGAPHIVNIYFEGILKGEVLLHLLEANGVYVSSGSACHSKRPEPSHVLKEMGYSNKRIDGSIRVSFSKLNTKEEVVKAAAIIKEAVEELKSL